MDAYNMGVTDLILQPKPDGADTSSSVPPNAGVSLISPPPHSSFPSSGKEKEEEEEKRYVPLVHDPLPPTLLIDSSSSLPSSSSPSSSCSVWVESALIPVEHFDPDPAMSRLVEECLGAVRDLERAVALRAPSRPHMDFVLTGVGSRFRQVCGVTLGPTHECGLWFGLE